MSLSIVTVVCLTLLGLALIWAAVHINQQKDK